jgi:hypothetical protein
MAADDPIKPPHDHRNGDPAVPPCRDCGSDQTHIVARMEYALYISCGRCGLVWGIRKPDQPIDPF